MAVPTDTGATAPDVPVAPASPTTLVETHEEISDLAAMTIAERRQWNLTGDLPKRAKSPDVAAAAPPQTPAPQDAASGSPSPEPEADRADPIISRFVKTPPPPGISRRQHERNELIRAALEAEQRIAELQGQIEGRTAPGPGQPQPKQDKAFDGTDPNDPRPTLEQFEQEADPYAAYIRADIRWELRKEERAKAFQAQEATRQQQTRETLTKWQQRRDAFASKETQFAAVAGPFLNTLQIRTRPDLPPTPISDVSEFIVDSEKGPELAFHLAQHPDEFTRIVQLPSSRQVFAAMGALEASLSAKAAPAAPAAPVVTSAPSAPSTLGTRPADPADEAASALERGDFSAYEREMLRRDLAKVGRPR